MNRPPLGNTSVSHPKHIKDGDRGEKNRKRIKEYAEGYIIVSTGPIVYEEMGYEHTNIHEEKSNQQGPSSSGSKFYKETVVGKIGEDLKEGEVEISDKEVEPDDGGLGVTTEEMHVGGYDCLMFVLSKAEEKHFQRP